ncbi:MAG: nickel pincer cofactor biosynthesis protein LarB [Chloroflexota bacterium]|nr:nickel pincer cofactor biosynthesis protein LarB [Chloroflexota bacterium]
MRESGAVRPFDAVRAALQNLSPEPLGNGSATVRLDLGRAARTGIPEVIHAERKHPDEVVAALRRQAESAGRAVASRCAPEVAEAVRLELDGDFSVDHHERARMMVVARAGGEVVTTGGRVGVLAAGTSDLPVASEAALMAREMGATVDEAWDVGVAGLHRLVAPLERMIGEGADVIVVAAGMDGALPSVVAGLVPVPVIGLPTSVGYGFGGGGIGALTTMLQSCAPGLVVVNIDNGIGAGSTAALIANRAAAGRQAAGSAGNGVEAGQ